MCRSEGRSDGKDQWKGDQTSRGDSPVVVEAEVEKSFWFSRPDGWVINRKTKKITCVA